MMIPRPLIPILLLFLSSCYSSSRNSAGKTDADAVINAGEVQRIELVLASDAMKGRKTFSPEIDSAAHFIAGEFKKTGLQPWQDRHGFREEFTLVRAKPVSVSGRIGDSTAGAERLIVITCKPKTTITSADGFETVFIRSGDNLLSAARNYLRMNKNLLVICDRKHTGNFNFLARLKGNLFKTDRQLVFILADAAPEKFSVEAEHEITEQSLSNVVAVLPGKSRKQEYVIFSAHYDHLGVTRPVNGDSIYNGANDDAAGVTAVVMLARYFKKLNNNERTLVFAAFTAEEIGGYGSQYFSRQFDPGSVAAMFNIEMIGTESKWGKNSAFITGFDKSSMGTILQENLKGTGFTFYPDPYPAQDLFYRSDNATLARLGVPAHSISTAKMENEPHYHRVTDEVKTLDLENMARIIKAIALSAGTIISGKDTPTRVEASSLR